jgi:hypothetical protein
LKALEFDDLTRVFDAFAVISIPRFLPSETMAWTIFLDSALRPRLSTKQRSIFSVLIGNWCRTLRDEYPVPKSSMAELDVEVIQLRQRF